MQGTGASSTGKSKGAVNSLKSAASGLIPAKRGANSSLIEATTLTQVSGSTSSGTQANCDISSMRWRTVREKGSRSQLLDRTLLRTDGVHHSDVALLDEVPIREWLHPASKDAGNIITGTHYLVGLRSLLAEERSCFLQVAWQSIDGVFPLRRRHRPKVWCSMLCLPVAFAC